MAGGRVMLVPELLAEIASAIRSRKIHSAAVPEQYTILRTIQFMCQHEAAISSPAPNHSLQGRPP